MSFESRVGFFKSGLTNADLRSFGNIPVLIDRLTIWVTTGTMTSTQYGRSLDVTGSERHVDFGELKIKFLIFAVVAGSNVKTTRRRLIRKGNWININQRKVYTKIFNFISKE